MKKLTVITVVGLLLAACSSSGTSGQDAIQDKSVTVDKGKVRDTSGGMDKGGQDTCMDILKDVANRV